MSNTIADIFPEEFEENHKMEESEVAEVILQAGPGEPMEVETTKSKKKRLRRKLMLSVWLVEKPDDLEENWMVKLCPTGKHHLVVARGKTTNAYNKYGTHIQTFQSCLPGGNRYAYNGNVFTVLDCIFHPQKKCYFVIDLLAWNSVSFRDTDVSCRYFWLESKFEEIQELQTTSSCNKYPFYKVEALLSDQLKNQLSNPYMIQGDHNIKLDGILFYLKDAPYKMCITPNVGWLKPFMVKEVLGIDVHESFQAPPNYVGMIDYLARSEKSRNQYKQKNLEKMIL